MASLRSGRGPGQRRDLTLPFVIDGVVVEGDRRGRELGFPTANILLPELVVAPEGVYAGTARRGDGSCHRAAISIGRRETFYGDRAPSLVEAYLLDFAGDLYGELLSVEIVRQLREQERFTSVEDLIDQIRSDVAAVRRVVDLQPWQSVEAITTGAAHFEIEAAARELQ